MEYEQAENLRLLWLDLVKPAKYSRQWIHELLCRGFISAARAEEMLRECG